MPLLKEWDRPSFQEAMELIRLPDDESNPPIQKFMSRRPAWVPAKDLPWETMGLDASSFLTTKAFGGVVYAMAPLAAARVVEEEDGASKETGAGQRGIHSIHGVFTNPGMSDRPYVIDVSEVHSSRSFSTRLVHAKQPTSPSTNTSGPFPQSDSDIPIGKTCLTCLVTFKRPTPSPSDVQISSPQERYRDILSHRAPSEWDPSPQADVDGLKMLFGNVGHCGFPILDMHKVDMTEFNEGKPIPERRELIYYRLLKPLPEDDVNAHILCHAFESDRNGLIMLGNHLEYGFNLGSAASLSYSFYVHVNADEAVMKGDGWWLQEVYWPRYSAGRGAMETLTWSPEGKHVATGYQDGIIQPRMSGVGREKL